MSKEMDAEFDIWMREEDYKSELKAECVLLEENLNTLSKHISKAQARLEKLLLLIVDRKSASFDASDLI
jgi:2-succinyl-5-enolpyruvyl-6-hydroxy-3-cyclohexene-1-carboxylate synthase